jgi:hypothetical protein
MEKDVRLAARFFSILATLRFRTMEIAEAARLAFVPAGIVSLPLKIRALRTLNLSQLT